MPDGFKCGTIAYYDQASCSSLSNFTPQNNWASQRSAMIGLVSYSAQPVSTITLFNADLLLSPRTQILLRCVNSCDRMRCVLISDQSWEQSQTEDDLVPVIEVRDVPYSRRGSAQAFPRSHVRIFFWLSAQILNFVFNRGGDLRTVKNLWKMSSAMDCKTSLNPFIVSAPSELQTEATAMLPA